MPEGPSIVILKEQVQSFTGKKIISASGDSKIDQDRLIGQKVIAFKSWGKHFLICFKGFTVRIHLLMFGTYTINERKPGRSIRLNLQFKEGEINFYTCSVKLLEGDADDLYDWTADIMNDEWNPAKAKKKLKTVPDVMICDALLDQDIFAGLGNIIKNEILYRVRIHPESFVGDIPAPKVKKLVDEARIYAFQFLEWKKKFKLKEHWLAHEKKMCPRCNLAFIKKHTGAKKRRSFFCENCQELYE